MFFSVQKSIGEQHRTLECFTAIIARAHRMGDKKRHRAHWPGTRLRRCGCTTKTTGKSSNAVSRIDYLGSVSSNSVSRYKICRRTLVSIYPLSSVDGHTPFNILWFAAIASIPKLQDSSQVTWTWLMYLKSILFHIVLLRETCKVPHKLIGRIEYNYV